MKTINLKEHYAHITEDTYIEVSSEVYELFEAERKAQQADRRKKYRNNGQYSLDLDDGIEYCVLFRSLSPCEIYERKLSMAELHSAIAMLPDIQAKRIYAHYFLGVKKSVIARVEGVNKSQVSRSIDCGLKHLEKILKKNF